MYLSFEGLEKSGPLTGLKESLILGIFSYPILIFQWAPLKIKNFQLFVPELSNTTKNLYLSSGCIEKVFPTTLT